jgi:hypothetical protein
MFFGSIRDIWETSTKFARVVEPFHTRKIVNLECSKAAQGSYHTRQLLHLIKVF